MWGRAHIAGPRSGALGRLAAVVGGTDGLLRNTTSDALLGEKPGSSPSEIGLLTGNFAENNAADAGKNHENAAKRRFQALKSGATCFPWSVCHVQYLVS